MSARECANTSVNRRYSTFFVIRSFGLFGLLRLFSLATIVKRFKKKSCSVELLSNRFFCGQRVSPPAHVIDTQGNCTRSRKVARGCPQGFQQPMWIRRTGAAERLARGFAKKCRK